MRAPLSGRAQGRHVRRIAPKSQEGGLLRALAGIRAIGDLLFNPFAPANLERIDVQVDVEYRADVAEIVSAQLSTDAIEPGTRPSLRVTLRPYNGAEYTESVPLEVPRSLAGQLVKIEVAAGNLVKPPQAAPEKLGDLVDNLRKQYPARSIVVSIQAPDDALALRGNVLDDLPPSVIDTLRPSVSFEFAASHSSVLASRAGRSRNMMSSTCSLVRRIRPHRISIILSARPASFVTIGMKSRRLITMRSQSVTA